MKEHRIQIDSLKSEIGDLKASLEFSPAEIVDLKKLVAGNVKVISSTNEVSDTVNEISKRLTMAETEVRRCNIRVDGLAGDLTENSEQTQSKVVKFIKDKLSVNITPQCAFRLSINQRNPLVQKLRTILLKCSSYTERSLVFKQNTKLRATNVYLNEDFSPAVLAIRKSKMDEMYEKRRNGYIAYFIGSELVVKNPSRDVKEAPPSTKTTQDKEANSSYHLRQEDSGRAAKR